MKISEVILQQLGSYRFIAMTGARDFVGDKNSLQFRLPARFAQHDIRSVVIELLPCDTYRMRFYKMPKKGIPTLIKDIDDVYANQLQRVFTDTTGLDTHL